MPGIEIRDAKPGDEGLIRELAEATWWTTYEGIISGEQIRYMLDNLYDQRLLHAQLSTSEQQYIILSDGDQPGGFASYSERAEDPFTYKVNKLYVLPQNQGKGYGRKLLDIISGRLRASQIKALELNVNRDNPALTFYTRYGFAVVRQEDIPIGPYWMNDYVMRLELGPSPIA